MNNDRFKTFYDCMGNGKDIYVRTNEVCTVLYIVGRDEEIQRVELTPRAVSMIMETAESNGVSNFANEIDVETGIPRQRREACFQVRKKVQCMFFSNVFSWNLIPYGLIRFGKTNRACLMRSKNLAMSGM